MIQYQSCNQKMTLGHSIMIDSVYISFARTAHLRCQVDVHSTNSEHMQSKYS